MRCDPHDDEAFFSFDDHLPLPLIRLTVNRLIDELPPAIIGYGPTGNRERDYHYWPWQFEIVNQKHWQGLVTELVKREMKIMGFVGAVQAQLEEFVVYTPGGHERTIIREDRESDPSNTVAYFIVRVPSVCTGGELVCNNTVVFDQRSDSAPFDSHYFIYDKNLPVEKMPLIDGYELNLVYAVTAEMNEFYASSSHRTEIGKSLAVLSRVNSGFVLFTDNYETDQFKQLVDMDRKRYLLHVCNSTLPQNQDFEIFECEVKKISETLSQEKKLCNFQRVERSDELVDAKFEININEFHRFFLPHESEVLTNAEDLNLDKYWRKPGFEGKIESGAVRALVFWPTRMRFAYLLAGNLRLAVQYLDTLCRLNFVDPEFGNFSTHFHTMIRFLLRKKSVSSLSAQANLSSYVCAVLGFLKRHNRLDMVVRCLNCDEFRTQPVEWAALVNLLVTFGWSSLKSTYLFKLCFITGEENYDTAIRRNIFIVKVRGNLKNKQPFLDLFGSTDNGHVRIVRGQ
jgi:hypothetical protein